MIAPRVVRRPHGLQHRRVVVEELVLRAQADQVGVRDRLEPALDVQVVVGAARAPGPGRGVHDPEVEDRVVVLGVVGLAPHLDQRAEPERLGPVLHDHGHLLHAAQHAPDVAENQRTMTFLPLVAGSR